jgi:hypothetical protein
MQDRTITFTDGIIRIDGMPVGHVTQDDAAEQFDAHRGGRVIGSFPEARDAIAAILGKVNPSVFVAR